MDMFWLNCNEYTFNFIAFNVALDVIILSDIDNNVAGMRATNYTTVAMLFIALERELTDIGRTIHANAEKQKKMEIRW